MFVYSFQKLFSILKNKINKVNKISLFLCFEKTKNTQLKEQKEILIFSIFSKIIFKNHFQKYKPALIFSLIKS